MGLVDDAKARRSLAQKRNMPVIPDHYQGITKTKIARVLSQIDRSTDAMIEAVFAMLCDEPNWLRTAQNAGFRFCDGATTAHIGTHIGIFQRGNGNKLDREGRDYWLKPLWEIGAVEKVTFDSQNSRFVSGHPIAKSPNCAYKLNDEFRAILASPEGAWLPLINTWIKASNVRERLSFQAEQAQLARRSMSSSHSELIQASCEYYVTRFLPGFDILYIDDGDGDRITSEQTQILQNAGIEIRLGDAMPDVLLWNRATDHLWVIEAVTSDGEVDLHKKQSLEDFALRNGKAGIGFTTTYPTWKKAAERQSQLKNIANGTFIWIQEDASRNILVQQ